MINKNSLSSRLSASKKRLKKEHELKVLDIMYNAKITKDEKTGYVIHKDGLIFHPVVFSDRMVLSPFFNNGWRLPSLNDMKLLFNIYSEIGIPITRYQLLKQRGFKFDKKILNIPLSDNVSTLTDKNHYQLYTLYLTDNKKDDYQIKRLWTDELKNGWGRDIILVKYF